MQEALMALDTKCQVTELSEPPFEEETASEATKIAGEQSFLNNKIKKNHEYEFA